MKKTRDKYFVIVNILFVVSITFMTIGFAYYNQILNLHGTATVKPDGKIYIKSVVVQSKTATATVNPDPIFTDEEITNFNLSFNTDNNLYTEYNAVFEITIANESSYDFLYNMPEYNLTVYKDGIVYDNLVMVTTQGISSGESIAAYSEKTITATITFTNPDLANTGTYVVNGEFTPNLKEDTVGRLVGAVDTSTIGNLTGTNQTAAFSVNVLSTYDTAVNFTITVADTNKYVVVDSAGNENHVYSISANNPGQDYTFYLKKAQGDFEFNSEIEKVKILVVPTGENGVNSGMVRVRVDTNGQTDTVAPTISNVTVAYSSDNNNNELVVSWKATDNAGDGALDTYTVIPYKQETNGSYSALQSVIVPNKTATFTDLDEGTYYFTVYGKDTSNNTATAGEIQRADTSAGHASRSADFTAQWKFTVTYSLSGGAFNKSNNTVETAYRFTNYTSTLNVTNNGYKCEISSVTMGGTDKNYSYNNNQITIQRPITGNIIITAQAVEEGNTCLVAGTEILLANGKYKKIEDIKYTDLLTVYDHVNGGITYAYPIWIEKEFEGNHYRKITLSDGTELKIVNNHCVFDVDKKIFIDAGNDEQCKIGTRIYKWKNNKLEIVTIENIEEKSEKIKFYNVISSKYYNIIANDVITTDPTTGVSNVYGFDENAIYGDNFYKISKGIKLPYIFFKNIMPKYLYSGLNLKNGRFLLDSRYVKEDFLCPAVDERTVEPIKKDGKRYFMMTTSLDNINEDNVENYLFEEGSYYRLPRNGAKYFIDTFTNKKYKPGKKIKVEYSMHLKAIQ